MAAQAKFKIKINASPELVADLQNVVAQNPDAMKLESAGPANEPSLFKLGLEDVATLVAILNGAATLAKFALAVYTHFSSHKGKSQRITVQTPLRTIEIRSSDAASEQRVLELMQAALRV